MRIRIQKAIALITIGAITFGILHGYSDFYEQVVQYTQSMSYREGQEAIKEHRIQVTKKYEQLSTNNKPRKL